MKNILNVGQCNPDHASISQLLADNFQVQIQRAESHEDALKLAREKSFDLILVNRVYDATGTEGLATLKQLKSEQATSAVPVMLVSNFEDAQAAAVELGAEQGFGKSALKEASTVERLRGFLGSV